MKKFYSSIFSVSAVLCGMLLTSCLSGDGTNKMAGTGIFTVVKEDGGYSLFLDYGGMVRPTQQSVTQLTGKEGFYDGDRVRLSFNYTDDSFVSVPGKGTYINNAELYEGQRIPKFNILTKEEAMAKKVLDKDSIFVFNPYQKLDYGTGYLIGAYRGYLTAQFNGYYTIGSDARIYPTLNMVYDAAENTTPDVLKLRMYYNRHSKKDGVTSGTEFFYVSYPLQQYASKVQGVKDTITVSVLGEGIKNDSISFRILRKDLLPADYLYFNDANTSKK